MNSKTTQAIAEAQNEAQAAQNEAQNTDAQRTDTLAARAAEAAAEPEPQAVKIRYTAASCTATRYTAPPTSRLPP